MRTAAASKMHTPRTHQAQRQGAGIHPAAQALCQHWQNSGSHCELLLQDVVGWVTIARSPQTCRKHVRYQPSATAVQHVIAATIKQRCVSDATRMINIVDTPHAWKVLLRVIPLTFYSATIFETFTLSYCPLEDSRKATADAVAWRLQARSRVQRTFDWVTIA